MGDEGSPIGAVGEKDFGEKVLQAPVPVLVDFWAPWCGPCRAVRPTIEELAKAYAGRVQFVAVNVDDNQDLAAKYGIQGIPTFLIFKAGKIAGQIVGAQGKKVFDQALTQALAAYA